MSDKAGYDPGAAMETIEQAIAFGSSASVRVSAEGFDASVGHVRMLLGGAVAAYEAGSLGTAVFLAITSMEETAKAELLAFRLPCPAGVKPKCRDPLRDHGKKHAIAIGPTTFMSRLPKLLGEETCARLADEAHSGGFVDLRERALYVHVDDAGVSMPATVVDRDRARELLLLALECADDALVGWTNASFAEGQQFEAWIAALAAEHAGQSSSP